MMTQRPEDTTHATDSQKRVSRIRLQFDPPTALLDVARELVATPTRSHDEDLKWMAISELRRAAYLDGRWDALQTIAATLPNDDVCVFNTHSEIVAALKAEPDAKRRSRLFVTATQTRHPDALFMRADEVIAALPAFAPAVHRPVVKYLAAVALNVNRAQTSWERGAGASPEHLRVQAAEDLRKIEDVLATHYPAALDVHLSTREAFLNTLGVLRVAPADARRHWEWLLKYGRVDPALIDAGLRAAHDTAAVHRAWEDGVRAWKDFSPEASLWTDGVLARHLARVGNVDEASRVLAAADMTVPWYIYALKDVPLDRIPDFIGNRFRRYLDLKASGFDFESIEWMMSRFSLIRELNELTP